MYNDLIYLHVYFFHKYDLYPHHVHRSLISHFIIPMKVRAQVESSKMARSLVDARHLKHVIQEMVSHKKVAFLRAGSVHRDAKVRARVRRESR